MRRFGFGFVLLVCASWSFSQTSQPSNGAGSNSAPAATKPKATPADESPTDATPAPADDAASSSTTSTPATSDPANDDRNFSSSRETLIDISPPNGDRKEHPNSAAALSRATGDDDETQDSSDVQEFHEWNPMKALKDVEVGDYYFKRKNYRAALDRYKEALVFKKDDAVATFRLAVCQEQLRDRAGAIQNYAAYLKILPHGPFADQASASIERLGGESVKPTTVEKDAAKGAEPEKP